MRLKEKRKEKANHITNINYSAILLRRSNICLEIKFDKSHGIANLKTNEKTGAILFSICMQGDSTWQ